MASAPSEVVTGEAMTLNEFPVSGSVAVALGTVKVPPALASTVYGEDCEIVMTGLSAVGTIRMHC